ncbi:hypothetical protein EON65_52155 [archaeon]|nr:MAG: hypothetical protein EON65_52155 [archaeon]
MEESMRRRSESQTSLPDVEVRGHTHTHSVHVIYTNVTHSRTHNIPHAKLLPTHPLHPTPAHHKPHPLPYPSL